MSRGNYQKISAIDKERILKSFNDGKDFVKLAKTLEIKRTTAYNIIKSNRVNNLPKGGAKNRKIDSECMEFIVNQLEINPLLTLKQLIAKTQIQFPNKPYFQEPALSKALDGQVITLKMARDTPADRNSDSTITARFEYATWLMSPEAVNARKIFIDEFGCNIHTRRTPGRSKKEINFPH